MPRLSLLLALCALLQASALILSPATAPRRTLAASSISMMATDIMRSGDMVKVISGDSKGMTAKLLAIDKKKGKVVVEGVNLRTKHVKPMKEGEAGSLLKKEMPISISNIALSDEQPAAVEAPAAE